ncbi:MAG: isochorismate lyase [Candidatus Sulfopaludibacter sp.]|nr:isochorismate lyase [Candidatus Sulfopaludibacter sp.]
MKSPADCASLEEVRAQIDRLDEQIVRLIGQRAGYVKAAARFKDSEHAVAAPDRFAAMLQARRQWAEREGLSPDVIEAIYRELVRYFIAEEKEHWRNSR